jgi:adenylate cyclase, class 2
MAVEYEVKVLDIDVDSLKSKLVELGFSRPEKLDFKRFVYDIPGQEKTWLRLRSDNKKTTITLKKFVSDNIDGTKEFEIVTDSFDTAHEFLINLGYKQAAYQENRRTLYRNSDIEVSIDEWPLIPPYLEIEGRDVESVKKYIEKLGLSNFKHTSDTPKYVYSLYGFDLDKFKELKF